ncbi:hypothetical protein [Methylopila sp. 73B]|uniref:hypothetical protein n=1 Tax=Methylopila sp. 73B TaxID=1120792 RepID=UPI0012DC5AD1|nr:hypothetical protein [Methylopila sp. 73B]
MAKFTDGPWRYVPYGIVELGAPDRLLYGDGDASNEDMHLIAASLDLYEVVKHALACEPENSDAPWVPAARAALAKAEAGLSDEAQREFAELSR